ncbi:MAG: hypothetical protein IJS59_02225 [Bacteroidaceae bacterium]|nr:hypothetical protein [Bacteroidaceae bacterium]
MSSSSWMASLTHGLLRVTGHGTAMRAEAEPLPCRSLASVGELADGQLLVGTHDDGFLIYDPHTRRASAPLLRNVGICRFLRDDHGRQWITTTRGLYRYDAADSTLTSFGISFGLTTDHFSRNSGYMDAQGIIHVGTMEGLVTFDPSHLNHAAAVAVPHLFTLLPEGRPLLFAEEVTLPHDASFSIHYATDCHTTSRSLWFRYRLEGTRSNWTVSQDAAPISFYNLPPGRYVLHLQASADSGRWPQEERLLHIHVLQPWWWTCTARIVYALLLCAAAIASYHIYSRRRRAMSRQPTATTPPPGRKRRRHTPRRHGPSSSLSMTSMTCGSSWPRSCRTPTSPSRPTTARRHSPSCATGMSH